MKARKSLGKFIKFRDVPLGDCLFIKAGGSTHLGMKFDIPQARPFSAVTLFNHPTLSGAPGMVQIGADASVFHLPDAELDFKPSSENISFQRNEEIPGTILQDAKNLFLVSFLDSSTLVYIDLLTGDAQYHLLDYDFVVIKNWSIIHPSFRAQDPIVLFSRD